MTERSAAAGAGRIIAGAAEIDITPPVGIFLAGYGCERISESVLTPLKARALVLGEGKKRCALLGFDLLAMPKTEGDIIRRRIAAETGIAAERIMLCCTHAHTGPELRGQEDWCRWPYDETYMDDLERAAVELTKTAARDQAPAVACIGVQREEDLAFNRRFRMRDGSEQFGPDRRNPTALDVDDGDRDCAGPAGPTDPDFGVIALKRDLTAKPFAMIVNYALHVDVTSGSSISADYPGVMSDVLKRIYGDGLVTLFVQGASGNINHCAYLRHSPYPHSGEWKSGQIGRAFAGKAMNIAEKALPSRSAAVDVVRTVLEVRRYPKNDPVVQGILSTVRAKRREELTFFEREFVRSYDAYSDEGTDLREVMTMRIGDAVLCSAPGELFVEWGLEIKRWSPFSYTFIAALCNDYVGYIPTAEAIRRGGYEATPIISVRADPALGMMVADANFRNMQILAALK